MKRVFEAKITENKRIASLSSGDIFKLCVEYPETPEAGQFVNLYTGDNSKLLPRPISVCRYENSVLTLVYRAGGAGTEIISRLSETVRISSPLGNGYDLSNASAEAYLLIGGGIGIPPMLELAAKLSALGKRVTVVLGYRTAPAFLEEEFSPFAEKVLICSDDGSCGFHGNALDCVRANGVCADIAYACGPRPMLKAVCEYAADIDLPVWVSLEERMGCGYGACVGCVCDIEENGAVSKRRVCKDGPVFEGRSIVW